MKKASLLEHALVCERCRTALEQLLIEEGTVKHALEEGAFPPMRRQRELQSAHDLMLEVARDPAMRRALIPDILAEQRFIAASSVLCWALGHDLDGQPDRHGGQFAKFLKELEQAMQLDRR